jgi:bifunctional non-homologous end joining protein LigD
MEPRAGQRLPEGSSYIYQVKWDGMRLLASWDGNRLLLTGKSLKDKTVSYPELAILTGLVKAQSFLLDGELIALQNGRPSFFTLMQRENSLARREITLSSIPVYYMVFDLLLQDGTWLLDRPWEARQELLQGSLEKHPVVHRTESYADGKNLLEAVAEKGMEGVVAKNKESFYIPGPRKSSYWIKTKLQQTLRAVVGGIYLKGKKTVSLLLGLADKSATLSCAGPKKIRYIGSVSSGLSEEELDSWLQWGRENTLTSSPFFNPPPVQPGRNIIWIKPDRLLQVSFSEWTPGLKLRSPRIKHLPPGKELLP